MWLIVLVKGMRDVKHSRLLLLFLSLLVAGGVCAQDIVNLVTWNGDKRSWELGTETNVEAQTIAPLVGAVSADGTMLLRIYPSADSYTSSNFQPIPAEAVRPLRDVSHYTFISNDSTVWVEDWPTNGGPPYLNSLDGLPPAHYTFDFGGMGSLDQRWQWMMTYENAQDTTSLYLISYSAPEMVASFSGRVVSEPRMHETRANGDWSDFDIRFTWPTEALDGMVVLDEGTSEPDTIAWAAAYDPISLVYSPRLIEGERTMFGIVPISGNTYKLYHQQGDVCLDRGNIDSQVPPRLFTTTEYQRTDLLDADFIAWVERINGVDVIKWERYQYQFGYDTPEITTGEIPCDGSVNRLRAQYAAGIDDYGPYDSWYLVWSEYDEFEDVTYLRSMMADRNPPFDTDIASSNEERPTTITLHSTYPNPFNASTVVPFELSKAGKVRIAVYDMLGREVGVLLDNTMKAGSWKTSWTPAKRVASGTYLIRLNSGEQSSTVRSVLIQ